ncbi:MAG: acireductone synthase [Alphaproteobacteria bacterium]|nr:acireductone synthase [Alphaproteobacteria bacterium]
MTEKAQIKAILTDIEGTTSALSFVKDVLFPYAYNKLPAYIRENQGDISEILGSVREIENNASLNTEEVIETMRRWIEEDRKITPLKTLQGMIWQEGYENGELQGHIYIDALEGLQRWKAEGLPLYIYSSGSVPAQKLLFAHTTHGDLTPLFSGYFDTHIGSKLEKDSYERIAAHINVPASAVLFLSDNIGEIEAASATGMNVILLDRDSVVTDTKGYKTVQSFDEIDPALGLAA